MNDGQITSRELLRGKINSETARMRWKELQRFFAGGHTLVVAPGLDLVEVAYQMQQDQAQQIEQWMLAQQIRQVSSDEARQWFNNDEELWTCVVKPWVLVQPLDDPGV